MALTLGQANKGSNSIPAPEGNHVARCCSVIDLGTHEEDGQYGLKRNRKIRIAWELVEEKHVFSEEKGEEPFLVSKTFNFIGGEKSNLIKTLTSWRGKPFTSEELEKFELKKLVGQPCLIQVVHSVKKDKTYSNVEAVTALPKGMVTGLVGPQLEQIYYEIDMGRGETFQKLPKFIQEVILKCEEWKAKDDFNQEPEEEDLNKIIPKDEEMGF